MHIMLLSPANFTLPVLRVFSDNEFNKILNHATKKSCRNINNINRCFFIKKLH